MMPLTEEQRKALIERCQEFIKQCEYARHAEAMAEADEMDFLITQVALYALTAEPVLVVEPRDYQTVAQIVGNEPISKSVRPLFEGALILGQNLYTAPPVTAPVLPDEIIGCIAALAAAISLLEKGGKKAAASNKMFEQMLDDYRNALESGRNLLRKIEDAK